MMKPYCVTYLFIKKMLDTLLGISFQSDAGFYDALNVLESYYLRIVVTTLMTSESSSLL